VSSPSAQRSVSPADQPTSGGDAGERNLRVWPSSVSEVARWCRSVKLDPIPDNDVVGPNLHERRQLAALGGVAAALADRSMPPIHIKAFPIAVQHWLKNAPRPPAALVDALCADLREGFDPLALVYERIVAGPRRRRLGTFFTPTAVLDYMHAIVRRLPVRPEVVADPGAGVGAFTVAALRWWRECEVHAVDVNLVTLGLLATRPDLFRRSLADTQGHGKVGHAGDSSRWLRTRRSSRAL
jgi:hypothetical protein